MTKQEYQKLAMENKTLKTTHRIILQQQQGKQQQQLQQQQVQQMKL